MSTPQNLASEAIPVDFTIISQAVAKLPKFEPPTAKDSVVDIVTKMVVTNDEEARTIAVMLNEVINPGIVTVHAFYDPLCDVFNKAHKGMTAARANELAPWLKAETIVKGKLGPYLTERDAIVQRARIAESAAATKALDDQVVEDAIAIAAVNPALAETMIEQHTAHPANFVARSSVADLKIDGIGGAEVWSIDEDHIDLDKLIEFCASPEGKGFRHWLAPNIKTLRSSATDMKERFPSKDTCGVAASKARQVKGKKK